MTKVTRSRDGNGYAINFDVTVGHAQKKDGRWVFNRNFGKTSLLFPATEEAVTLNGLVARLQKAIDSAN